MNMQAIGRKISALRKERDMTQVDLADKLGVTYQAVSSWERGNSMPDIAKLPDISQVLAVSIDELLDDDKATTIIKNVLTGQDFSQSPPDMATVAEVAPILKPSQVENLAGSSGSTDTEAIVAMACHLSSETLKDIVLRCKDVDDKLLSKIACYMESEDLKDIALHCKHLDSGTIANIACYMESEDLKEIALHCKYLDSGTIANIACHMESEDLKEIALHCKHLDSGTISNIACHMESEDLAEIAAQLVKSHGLKALSDSGIIVHMDEEDIANAIKSAMGQ